MKNEIKKLCEAKQFSKAIVFVLKFPSGSERDLELKDLIIHLAKAGDFKTALEIIPNFADGNLARQLEIGICQQAERQHQVVLSAL